MCSLAKHASRVHARIPSYCPAHHLVHARPRAPIRTAGHTTSCTHAHAHRFVPHITALCVPAPADAGAEAFATPLVRGFFGAVDLPACPQVDTDPVQRPACASNTRSCTASGRTDDCGSGTCGGDGSSSGGGGGGGATPVRVSVALRLSAARAGTLAWRQGLDGSGGCAHAAMLEQVLELRLGVESWDERVGGAGHCGGGDGSSSDGCGGHGRGHGGGGGGGGAVVLSHVSCTGSVPLMWACPPCLGPAPPPSVPLPPAHAAAFHTFVARMLRRHGPRLTLARLPAPRRRGDAELGSVLRSVVDSERARMRRGATGAGAAVTGGGGDGHGAAGPQRFTAACSGDGGGVGASVRRPVDGSCLGLLDLDRGCSAADGARKCGRASHAAQLWRQLEPSVLTDTWYELRCASGPPARHAAAVADGIGAPTVQPATPRVRSLQAGVFFFCGWDAIDAPLLAAATVGTHVLAEQLEKCGVRAPGAPP
eukprot:193259-Chlamydomonas_euryale.AAC.1